MCLEVSLLSHTMIGHQEHVPTVSIVVPTYNRSHFIERAFSSLVEQDYPKDRFEIIVVDDGSSDRTPEILRRFQEEHSFFRYFSKTNKGPAAARNLGIRHAKGEIILFIDDDCLADKTWVRELIGDYEDEQVGGVAGRIRYVPPDNNIANQFAARSDGGGQAFCANGEIDFFITANASFRRDVINQVGGFDETFPHAAHEDVDLSHRVKQAGWKLVYAGDAVVHHYHYHNLKGDLKKWYQVGNAEALYQLKLGQDPRLWGAIFRCLLSFIRIPFSLFKHLKSGEGLKKSLAFPLIQRLHNLMVTSGRVRGYFSYRNSFKTYDAHDLS
jgi:glycosyltransferase involved in cell wall biosynthesis